MPRHKNKLLQFLENDDSAKQQFVDLVEQMNRWALRDHLRNTGFMGRTWYVSAQTIGNIMRRLGYRGMRGRRPKRSQVVANSGPRWSIR